MHVKKRNGDIVEFDASKIFHAISNANKDVEDIADKASIEEIRLIEGRILKYLEDNEVTTVSIEEIQDRVEVELMKLDKFQLAKKYILYRERHESLRLIKNTTDKKLIDVVNHKDYHTNTENSNKNPMLLSTERDYIAGATSIDMTNRILLPERIVKAHEDGVLHFHDEDYFLQFGMFNCCLINIGDILDNGTCMNGKMIETPKSFQVACTVTTQVIAAVASNQYGGQSVDLSHLGKYLRISKDKYTKVYKEMGYTGKELEDLVAERTKSELKAGVQTIQYQINTLMTTNG
jgi:ribonucleoside-triphosphate reductase